MRTHVSNGKRGKFTPATPLTSILETPRKQIIEPVNAESSNAPEFDGIDRHGSARAATIPTEKYRIGPTDPPYRNPRAGLWRVVKTGGHQGTPDRARTPPDQTRASEQTQPSGGCVVVVVVVKNQCAK